MNEEEYIALAREQYASIKKLENEQSFYEYEKQFSEIWTDLGRKVIEKSISKVPENAQKKTLSGQALEKSK